MEGEGGGNSKIDAVQTRCSGQAAGGQQETKVQNPKCIQENKVWFNMTEAEGGCSSVELKGGGNKLDKYMHSIQNLRSSVE